MKAPLDLLKANGGDWEKLLDDGGDLTCILRRSPSGFPNHTLLRDCWLELSKRFQIRSPCVLATIDWASDAADAIRLMCKHIVDLQRSGTQFVTSEISALVALIGTTTASGSGDQPLEASTPPLPLPAPPPAPPAARALRPRDSDVSVMSIGFRCACPDCRGALQPVPVPDVDETSFLIGS